MHAFKTPIRLTCVYRHHWCCISQRPRHTKHIKKGRTAARRRLAAQLKVERAAREVRNAFAVKHVYVMHSHVM